jgi:hypothetical protein
MMNTRTEISKKVWRILENIKIDHKETSSYQGLRTDLGETDNDECIEMKGFILGDEG